MANERKSPFIHGLRGADLTQMQRTFVATLVRQGCSPTQAARIAGYSSPRTAAYDLLRHPSVQTAVAFERSRYISGELANVATSTLHAVMTDPDAPAAARVAAARTVLEMSGDLGRSRQEASDEFSLSEMTADELGSLIARWQGERQAMASPEAGTDAEFLQLPH